MKCSYFLCGKGKFFPFSLYEKWHLPFPDVPPYMIMEYDFHAAIA